MQILSIIKEALFTAWHQWRIAAIVYAIQFLLVFTIGIQVFDVMQASIGKSLEINKLLHGYDHTVITDFLKVHGASITPLLGQMSWMLLVWLVFSVFIHAGMLYCATQPDQKNARLFWIGGASWFFPFLRISLLFLLFLVIWTAIIWVPLMINLEFLLQYFQSEKPTVYLLVALLLIYLCGLGFFYFWSVNTRLFTIKHGDGHILSHIKQGLKHLLQNKRGFLQVAMCFLVLHLFLFLCYWLLESLIGMSIGITVLIVFLMQQAFVFGRIVLRQGLYISCNLLLR